MHVEAHDMFCVLVHSACADRWTIHAVHNNVAGSRHRCNRCVSCICTSGTCVSVVHACSNLQLARGYGNAAQHSAWDIAAPGDSRLCL
jgi:hypothetical protein